MEVRISDAPRRNEIMVPIAVTDSGRPIPRVGGLTKDQIKGEDGLSDSSSATGRSADWGFNDKSWQNFRQRRCVLLFFVFLLATVLTAQTKSKADLIVSGGTVVSMDAKRTVYDDGAIVVNG